MLLWIDLITGLWCIVCLCLLVVCFGCLLCFGLGVSVSFGFGLFMVVIVISSIVYAHFFVFVTITSFLI